MKLFFGPSISSILQKTYGKEIQHLLKCDSRMIIDEVASSLHISTSDILSKLSAGLKIPFKDRLAPFLPSLLPTGIQMPFLWEKGIAPIFVDTEIIAVATSNPVNAKMLPAALTNYPLFLTSWRAICDNLHQSEMLHRSTLHEPTHDLAKAILEIILEEAHERSIAEIVISWSSAGGEYALISSDGSPHRGLLAFEGSEALKRYITSLDDPELSIFLPNTNKNVQMILNRNSKGFVLRNKERFSEPQLSNVIPLRPQTAKITSSSVYLVDDDKGFLSVTERFLLHHGIVARSFLSAQVCVDALNKEHALPSVIVTDMHMQGWNGDEFIRNIKSHEELKHIPIISLSGDEQGVTELSLLEAGAAYVIMKRGDPRILLHLIRRYISPQSMVEARA